MVLQEKDAEKAKGHVFTWPFKFWLPDLDSNQGPAD